MISAPLNANIGSREPEFNTSGELVNPWAIDSLKIRIPLREVGIIDETMRDIVAKVSTSTGEVLEERENKKTSRDENGIKTEFSIEQRATNNITVKYLIILVNAKQLKEKYFEGINLDNAWDLYMYLLELNAVVFTFESFLNAECTDIDFRKDFRATDEQMKDALKHLHQHAQPSADYDKGSKLFWQKDNKGLQFNKRNTTKIHSAPFVKIYSKTLDFIHKSNIFALSFFSTLPQDLWRLEFTIKNKKHLQMNGHGNTFRELISLNPDEIEQMSTKTLRAVLNRSTRPDSPLDPNLIPPRDIYEVNSLIMLLDSGHQWHNIKETLLGSLTRSNRSKRLRRMEDLYSSYIRPIERYSNQGAVSDILNQIGYTF